MQAKDSVIAQLAQGAWGLLKSTGESVGDLVWHAQNNEGGKASKDLGKVLVGGVLIVLSVREIVKARPTEMKDPTKTGSRQPSTITTDAAAKTKPALTNVRVTTSGISKGSFTIIAEEGRINVNFNPTTGNLNVDMVEVMDKNQGVGTELYSRAIEEASKTGEVKSVSAHELRNELLKSSEQR